MKPAWLSLAETEVGVREGPNNDTKYGKFYGLNHEPWCAMFVSWVCANSGHPLPSMQPGMPNGYASVWYGMQFAKNNHLWRPSWEAEPGDAIVYGWNGPGSDPADMHTGLIVSSGPRGSVGHTIEGNRNNRVEPQSFVVGDVTVLGTIALTKLLASKSAATMTVRPDAQPRRMLHPDHTGPTPLPEICLQEAAQLTVLLESLEQPIARQGGERKALRKLATVIDEALTR
ncbi:MAG: CHAP domain-containing protein [Frankiales bacterium]|nr:CHAP domain-containing protein [Frankiales bacterium]